MRTPEAIVNLYVQRRRDRVALHQQMAHIQAVYKGDVEIPLPDMGRTEQSSVPNLLQSGVDQMAGRIASVTPEAHFAIEGKGTRTPTRLAETRRRVVTGWWASDQLPIKTKKRARHLIAYSASPATVRYHPKRQRPTWQVRDPLTAYPAPDMQVGEVTPNDIVYSYRRSLAWCRGMGYSVEAILPNAATLDPDTQVTILEYHDIDQTTLIAYAEPGVVNGATWYGALGGAVTLEYIPNPIDLVPCTYPTRISLEDAGQFDGMIGMYYQQAKLMALEIDRAWRRASSPTRTSSAAPVRVRPVHRRPLRRQDRQGQHRRPVATSRTEPVAARLHDAPDHRPARTGAARHLRHPRRVRWRVRHQHSHRAPGRRRPVRRHRLPHRRSAGDLRVRARGGERGRDRDGEAYRRDDTQRTIYVGTGNNRTPVTYIAATCSRTTSTSSPTPPPGPTSTPSSSASGSASAWASCPRRPPRPSTRTSTTPSRSTTASSPKGSSRRCCPVSSSRQPPGRSHRWSCPRS